VKSTGVNPSGRNADSSASPLPLPTLLSQGLVAFTIEFDNEAEHQIPHWTTDYSARVGSWRKGLWLVSLAMYANCMQFVPEEGIRAVDLVRRARTRTNFRGMVRWGYITVKRDPTDTRPKPPRAEWIVRATEAGQNAQKIWRPLFTAIEKRWQERFGKDAIERLREALIALLNQIDLDWQIVFRFCSMVFSAARPATSNGVRKRSATKTSLAFRFRRCSRACCWPSRLNLSATQICRWRFAPTFCEC
jgi:hypothetical protein